MAEYAGYVAPTPIDFGAISSGLMSNKIAVGKMKQAEQLSTLKLLQKQQENEEKARIQARKEANEEEKLLRSDLENIKSPEYVPEKSFNTFATEGLGRIKEKILELNRMKKDGMISNQDYLINYNNIKDQWNQFTGSAKSFKDNLQSLTDSISKNEQSKIGIALIGMFANQGQLYNKVLDVKDVNGVYRLQQYTIDKDGNRIEDETITNIGALSKKDLFSDLKVDYDKKFTDAEKAIGNYKIEIDNMTVSDKTKKDKFEEQLNTQVQGIIPDDRDRARVLADKLGYEIYFTEDQKKALLDKGKKEDELIKFGLNDKGAYSPFLTKNQKDVAEKYVKENITGRMDYSETLDEQKSVKINVGGKLDSAQKGAARTLRTARNSYKELISGDTNKVIKDLADLYKNRYEYGAVARKLIKDGKVVGAAIYTLNKKGVPEREVDRATNEKDFFRLYTPKAKQGEEYVDYDTALEILGEAEGDFNNY